MESVLTVLGVLGIVATALPLIRSDMWWIRVLDFPRLQITLIIALVLSAYLYVAGAQGWGARTLIFALSVCLLRQGYMIYPYTFLARKQVQSSEHIGGDATCKLLFANVLMDNRNADDLPQIIRQADPDVILAVETDAWWQTQLKEFEETHPHTVHYPLDNTYGMLLYSRLELVNPEIKFLVEDDIPSIHATMKLRNGEEVGLHCMHPRPPFPTEAERSTNRDAELLLLGRSIKNRNAPVIVMGDLNDVAWSRTNYLFQDISGLLDPRIGRGIFNTFHAKYPFLRFPLDHFFHSNHFRLIELKRLAYFGSDHFPVFVALSYEPGAAAEQEKLQADAGQVKEATEKIEQAA